MYLLLGVDDLHCFFINNDGTTVPRSSYKNPTYDNSYRKVIQYISYQDGTDVVGGHGTHVCGTIVGFLRASDGNIDIVLCMYI